MTDDEWKNVIRTQEEIVKHLSLGAKEEDLAKHYGVTTGYVRACYFKVNLRRSAQKQMGAFKEKK